MLVLQFKGKTAIECSHHTVPHHTFEFDSKLSVLGKGEKPGLDGNFVIEGDNLIALNALLPTHVMINGQGQTSMTRLSLLIY